MTTRIFVDCNRAFASAALIGLSVTLAACVDTGGEITTATIPQDYRWRHPIAIHEADQSVVIFVGNARGGLSASQRTDVLGLAQAWRREATGAIVADVPVDTPNAAAAADAFRDIRSLLAAAGVPPRGITVPPLQPERPAPVGDDPAELSENAAVAGPCGLWPEDLGPTIMNPSYSENRPYYNFGCATQRNLAAMIDNPSDLVQPRPETPAYTARRTEGFEKYRKGTSTTTVYPEADKAALSDAGR